MHVRILVLCTVVTLAFCLSISFSFRALGHFWWPCKVCGGPRVQDFFSGTGHVVSPEK